jgi:type IV fimbrial biogenesis protein FimT
MNRQQRGFTLMELVVVLALASLIIGIGVPNFRDFQRNNRLTVAANDVLGGVIVARTEALRRQITISMCQSATPEDEEAATCGDGSGWIVFEDPDADCTVDAGEEWISSVTVATDVTANSNATCISFATTGFKRVVAGQPATSRMMYCDDRGNNPRNAGGNDSAARGIEVPPTGRGVVVRLVDEMEAWAEGDDSVECL